VPALISRAARMLPAKIAPASSIRASMMSPRSTSAARVSPMPRSMSHSGNRVPRRFQQHARLGERQADDVGIAPRDVTDVDLAIALECIAPGFAAPLPMARVIVDFFWGEPFHRDHRFD